jgi:hypothetical protein
MHALIGEDDRIVTDDDASSITDLASPSNGSVFRKKMFKSKGGVLDPENEAGLGKRGRHWL